MTSSVWGIAYTMTAVSLHGHTYVINIYKQGASSSVTLQAASKAFSFEENSDHDVLRPLRGSTGYIRYINTGISYDIFPNTQTDRFVEVTKNGNPFWYGFLVPESFTQPYDSAPFEIEIPCQSVLDVLETKHMSVPTTTFAQTTFASLIAEAFDDIMGEQTSIFSNLYFPRISNSDLTAENFLREPIYKFGFCEQNDGAFANANGIEGWTWNKVFEEYLKLFGMTMHMWGDSVYITIPTRTDEYAKYTWSQIRGSGTAVNQYAQSVGLLTYVTPQSTNNSYSHDKGKRALRTSFGCVSLEYGVSVDEDKFTTPVDGGSTVATVGDCKYILAICRTNQKNIILPETPTINNTAPCLFDIWDTAEDSKHLVLSWTKAIRVPVSTGTSYVEAFRVNGDLPFNGYTGGALLISGRVLTNMQESESQLLISLKVGSWYATAGSGWIQAISYISLPIGSNGHIGNNSLITVSQNRDKADGDGFLIPFTSGISFDEPITLIVYQKTNGTSGDFQYISGLKVEYSQGNSAQRALGGNLVLPTAIYNWSHEEGTNYYETILNSHESEDYQMDFNVDTLTSEAGFYAPRASIVRGFQYAGAYYSNPAEIITIGDAYAPDIKPNMIFNRDNVQYKLLSFGMNTYDDSGHVSVYKTTIGTT